MVTRYFTYLRHGGRTTMLLLSMAVATTLPAFADTSAAKMEIAGELRTYELHVPHGTPPRGGFPLVFVFHGGGMTGTAMARLTQFNSLADTRGFIAVYPDGIDKHWNDGRSTVKNPQDDVAFVSAMIARLRQQHPIAVSRIYATGISNGALFAQRLGCDLAPDIAAIAPVAGTMPTNIAARCRPVRPVAMLQISGTADPIMPFNGGAVADFGGRGEGGAVRSFDSTGAFWARGNVCRGSATTQAIQPIALLDRTRVISLTYTGCPPAGAVQLLKIEGGGHTWPGGPQYARRVVVGLVSRQLNASNAIVDFFLAQPTRR